VFFGLVGVFAVVLGVAAALLLLDVQVQILLQWDAVIVHGRPSDLVLMDLYNEVVLFAGFFLCGVLGVDAEVLVAFGLGRFGVVVHLRARTHVGIFLFLGFISQILDIEFQIFVLGCLAALEDAFALIHVVPPDLHVPSFLPLLVGQHVQGTVFTIQLRKSSIFIRAGVRIFHSPYSIPLDLTLFHNVLDFLLVAVVGEISHGEGGGFSFFEVGGFINDWSGTFLAEDGGGQVGRAALRNCHEEQSPLGLDKSLSDLEVFDFLVEVEGDLVVGVSGDPRVLEGLLAGVPEVRLDVADHLEKAQTQLIKELERVVIEVDLEEVLQLLLVLLPVVLLRLPQRVVPSQHLIHHQPTRPHIRRLSIDLARSLLWGGIEKSAAALLRVQSALLQVDR